MLKGRRILLGVTGSIAAYKAALIVRLLIKEGAEVRVIMTDASRDFITALTLSTLSKNPVLHQFTDDKESGEWNNHVDLGMWADLFLIAPASANSIAKMVSGVCDNLLMATFLSAKCPVVVAPAMDLDMYAHPSTQSNLETLSARSVKVIEASDGELASGLSGKGRLTEPEDILEYLKSYFHLGFELEGKRVLITAGPTYEDLDPVRFIGNRSSGKMGFELAHVAALAGGEVTLISGPSALKTPTTGINRLDIRSAEQMFEACSEHAKHADIVIMAAAVADYRPEAIATQKMKKSEGELNIALERTKDIIAHLAANRPHSSQLIVGFAMETENEEVRAVEKLQRKRLDAIVLNRLGDTGAGFAHDTNKVTLFTKDNNRHDFELKSKFDIAIDIFQTLSI